MHACRGNDLRARVVNNKGQGKRGSGRRRGGQGCPSTPAAPPARSSEPRPSTRTARTPKCTPTSPTQACAARLLPGNKRCGPAGTQSRRWRQTQGTAATDMDLWFRWRNRPLEASGGCSSGRRAERAGGTTRQRGRSTAAARRPACLEARQQQQGQESGLVLQRVLVRPLQAAGGRRARGRCRGRGWQSGRQARRAGQRPQGCALQGPGRASAPLSHGRPAARRRQSPAAWRTWMQSNTWRSL